MQFPDSLYGMSVLVMDRRPKPGIRQIIEQKMESGECLQCEQPAAQGRRGCCDRHYGQFRTARLEQAPRDRAAWEARQERLGKILPSGQGRRRGFVNAYRD